MTENRPLLLLREDPYFFEIWYLDDGVFIPYNQVVTAKLKPVWVVTACSQKKCTDVLDVPAASIISAGKIEIGVVMK
jgi:hypothetical protein